MNIGNRIALTLAIVLAMLLGLAVCGYQNWDNHRELDLSQAYELSSATAQTVTLTEPLYSDLPLDMRLLQLDKRALDEAYHNTLIKLWMVWLQEGAGDPKYFRNGLTNARRAYNMAAKQISDRESVLFERERRRKHELLQQQQQQDTPAPPR